MISVIIPVAPGEKDCASLIGELRGTASEILLVGPEKPAVVPEGSKWIHSPKGRALQLNAGAREARSRFLWFLHADSRLVPGSTQALIDALHQEPHALHYFDLNFEGGLHLMWLNDWGVYFRSRVLGLPFGDQGFCLSHEVFDRLGGFPEDAKFGEDHLFVWKAHKNGIKVRSTGAILRTSARKYVERGWLKTTFRHGVLTWKQAFEAWRK